MKGLTQFFDLYNKEVGILLQYLELFSNKIFLTFIEIAEIAKTIYNILMKIQQNFKHDLLVLLLNLISIR